MGFNMNSILANGKKFAEDVSDSLRIKQLNKIRANQEAAEGFNNLTKTFGMDDTREIFDTIKKDSSTNIGDALKTKAHDKGISLSAEQMAGLENNFSAAGSNEHINKLLDSKKTNEMLEKKINNMAERTKQAGDRLVDSDYESQMKGSAEALKTFFTAGEGTLEGMDRGLKAAKRIGTAAAGVTGAVDALELLLPGDRTSLFQEDDKVNMMGVPFL